MNNRKSKLPGIGTVYDVKKILEKKKDEWDMGVREQEVSVRSKKEYKQSKTTLCFSLC